MACKKTLKCRYTYSLDSFHSVIYLLKMPIRTKCC